MTAAPGTWNARKLESVRDVIVGPGQSVTVSGSGPTVGFQADVYTNVLAADVLSGKVDIHPTATPKVHEATFKHGHTGEDCTPANSVCIGRVTATIAQGTARPRLRIGSRRIH